MEDREVLYVGRFEIEVYGSFLQAKRASQTWCNQVKNDNDKKWVVVSENGKIEFSVENLGHSEAKKQAISLRYKNISN
eukprot:XP_766012.1 hypothetical protein [Theileria parva strain Muguga]